MFSFSNFFGYSSNSDVEQIDVSTDSSTMNDVATSFGNAVRNDIEEEGQGRLVSRCSEQPSKAPLFDVRGNYSLSAEEALQELFLEYFNFQGNDGFSRFNELDAKCNSAEMTALLELVTLFKRSARLGDGKKTTFLKALEYYMKTHPGKTYKFLVLVGLLGSCKDYRQFGNSKNNTLAHATAEFYYSFMTESFELFDEEVRENKGFKELVGLKGLFFKWMPINGKHRKSRFYKNMVRLYSTRVLGFDSNVGGRARNKACMKFRKFVVSNRHTPEQVMTHGLSKIDGTEEGLRFLNTLPSVTRTKHSGYTVKRMPRVINRALPTSLEEWRGALLRGDSNAKVNTAGGTVNAVSVLEQYMDNYTNSIMGYGRNSSFHALTPEQEIAFKDILEKGWETTRDMDMIPIIDLSGSMMSAKAINLALILAMIFTMRPRGHPLDGVWIAFSTNAKIINMGHCETATEWLSKFMTVVRGDRNIMGYSTDYELAITNLIDFAGKHNIPVPDVLCVTDMQVNEFRRYNEGINCSGSNYYNSYKPTVSDGDTVFTEKTLNMIRNYNELNGFNKIPNTFIVNCSTVGGLVPMTSKFENGAYYSCGTNGTQVSVLATIKAFCELKFDEVDANMCKPSPWTTMLKSMYNFNEKLKKMYEIDLLGDVILLGEDWFEL
jgi:hypothetical protein